MLSTITYEKALSGDAKFKGNISYEDLGKYLYSTKGEVDSIIVMVEEAGDVKEYRLLTKKQVVNTLLTECFDNGMPMILGPSGGIGGAFFEHLKEKKVETIGIGTRQSGKELLSRLAGGNKQGLYFLGDLFSENREKNDAIDALLSKGTANATGFHLYNAATNMDPMAELDASGNVLNKGGEVLEIGDEGYANELDAINPQTMKRWEEGMTTEDKNTIRKIEADKQVKLFHDYLENILQNRDIDNNQPLTVMYLGSIANMFGIAGSAYGDFKKECTELCEEYRIKFALKFGYGRVEIIDGSFALVKTKMGMDRVHLLETTGKIVESKGKILPVGGEKINQKEMFDADDVAKFFYDLMEDGFGKVPLRMMIHSDESIDLEKWKEKHQKDLEYINSQYIESDLSESDTGEVVLDEKAKMFLLNLREYKLNKYYDDYDKLYPIDLSEIEAELLEKYGLEKSTKVKRLESMTDDDWELLDAYNKRIRPMLKPSKRLLQRNISKGEKIFDKLQEDYTVLPREVFLDQALRFLNNHV